MSESSVRSDSTEVEEIHYIQTLDELIQRWIEEAKLQLRSGPKWTTAKVSDFPLSEAILECEFSQKFTTLISTTTPELAIQSNTSGIFERRW